MSGAAGVQGTSAMSASGLRALFRDRPLIPLVGLLGLLVLTIAIVEPSVVSAEWVGVVVRASIPLALLAACQTITFLTGGIDLSVGAVASMSGFLVATLVGGQGLPMAILIALLVAALAGLVSGIGVGVFRVHPLIMTLGMGLVVLGLANVWQLMMVQTGSGVPSELRWLGAGTFATLLPNSLLVFIPVAAFVLLHAAAHGLRPAAVRDRRQPDRVAAVGRPGVAGPHRPVHDLGGHRGDRRLPLLGPQQHRERHPRGHGGAAVGGRRGHRRARRSWAAAAGSGARSSAR